MPIKYYPDTPARVVIKALVKLLPICGQRPIALDFHGSIAAANGTALDMAINTPNERWAAWDLKVLGAETNTELRKVLIGKIKDSMLAFRLYLDLDFLTAEEDKMLEAIFGGKLPAAEKELAEGVVTRAKRGV